MEPLGQGSASRNRAIALSFPMVLAGGVVGWIAAYEGLGAWGLLVGLAVSAAPIVWLGVRQPRHAGLVGGFAFAFLVLTWPVLWLLVGYVRYLITGEPIEND